jgi:hypothetical protein
MSNTGYYETSYPPSLWNPTGVIAGTPGTFTPPGCKIPRDLYELGRLGPLGETTAWTTGQFVRLGDGTNATWSGTDWVSGIAPLAQTPEPPPPPEPEPTPEPEPQGYTAIPVEEPET